MTKGNILVTGGAGYIGSHACKALRDAGGLFTEEDFERVRVLAASEEAPQAEGSSTPA